MQISVPYCVIIVKKPIGENNLELLKDFIRKSINLTAESADSSEVYKDMLYSCQKGDCEIYLISNDFLESDLTMYKDLGINLRNVNIKQDCSRLGLVIENYKDLQKAVSGDSEAALKFCKDFNNKNGLSADNPKVIVVND